MPNSLLAGEFTGNFRYSGANGTKHINRLGSLLMAKGVPLASRGMQMPHRPLSEIAAEIKADWVVLHGAAQPYMDAMSELCNANDRYGMETGSDMVQGFLNNAQTWRGEVARRVKLELKLCCGTANRRKNWNAANLCLRRRGQFEPYRLVEWNASTDLPGIAVAALVPSWTRCRRLSESAQPEAELDPRGPVDDQLNGD
jgi:hypothetical protein